MQRGKYRYAEEYFAGGRKFMEHITLFTDILPEEQERMRVCFKVREKFFQNGETIMEYSSSMKKIGLIQEGRAVLYCCDEDGNEYVIDELNRDSVRFPALLCMCYYRDEGAVY